jgi:hypothetical protein
MLERDYELNVSILLDIFARHLFAISKPGFEFIY